MLKDKESQGQGSLSPVDSSQSAEYCAPESVGVAQIIVFKCTNSEHVISVIFTCKFNESGAVYD